MELRTSLKHKKTFKKRLALVQKSKLKNQKTTHSHVANLTALHNEMLKTLHDNDIANQQNKNGGDPFHHVYNLPMMQKEMVRLPHMHSAYLHERETIPLAIQQLVQLYQQKLVEWCSQAKHLNVHSAEFIDRVHNALKEELLLKEQLLTNLESNQMEVSSLQQNAKEKLQDALLKLNVHVQSGHDLLEMLDQMIKEQTALRDRIVEEQGELQQLRRQRGHLKTMLQRTDNLNVIDKLRLKLTIRQASGCNMGAPISSAGAVCSSSVCTSGQSKTKLNRKLCANKKSAYKNQSNVHVNGTPLPPSLPANIPMSIVPRHIAPIYLLPSGAISSPSIHMAMLQSSSARPSCHQHYFLHPNGISSVPMSDNYAHHFVLNASPQLLPSQGNMEVDHSASQEVCLTHNNNNNNNNSGDHHPLLQQLCTLSAAFEEKTEQLEPSVPTTSVEMSSTASKKHLPPRERWRSAHAAWRSHQGANEKHS